MTDSLNGKVALVTGASSGMGKATAIAFGAAGAKVVIAARRQTEGEATAQTIRDAGGKAIFIQTDVTKPDQVEAMVEGAISEFDRLDFAFNNAGRRGARGLLHELTIEEWDRTVDIYLKSVWLCMKFEIIQMLKQDGGSIINNSSVVGLKGASASPLLSTMKHGVVGLTKSTALQYGEDGIRVNAVCPGWIDTEITADWKDDPDVQSRLFSMQALKRHGESSEIAGLILWLCSDSAAFTTGATFVVDGGQLA